MTLDEAKLVARVVETAEGGCGGCVNEAVRQLNKDLPAFTWRLVDLPPRLNPMWPEKAFHPSIDVVYRSVAKPAKFHPIKC